MPWYSWSQTSSSNANADSTINWAEGQAPSSINDSARAMMSATAMYRDDIAGAIVTGGSTTAYTVGSFSVFDTLAHLNGQMIAFTPNATNVAGSPSVTLNVDGLGAKPLRSAPNVELLAGTIIQGTPYVAVYNNSDGAFYLRNFYGNPYNVPLLGGMDFWDTTTPNSSFIFPAGQAVSRTTYAYAFSKWGSAFGSGDGSTTFNVPDLRGRVAAIADNLGGSAAGRLTSASGMATGLFSQTGGGETSTLITGNLPAYTPTGTITNGAITSSAGGQVITGGGSGIASGTGVSVSAIAITSTQAGSSFAGAAQGGTSTPVRTVQPTIVCNYILRIL